VWRRHGERFADCCIAQRDRFGGGSVMVWAVIAPDCSRNWNFEWRPLSWWNFETCCCTVFTTPWTGSYFATRQCHTAHLSREQDISPTTKCSCVRLARQVPDLSPIEHAWDVLGRRVRGTTFLLTSFDVTLVQYGGVAMRFQANGGHTRY